MEYSLYYQRQLDETAQQVAISEQHFWNGLSLFMRKQLRTAPSKKSTASGEFCVCLAHYCEVKGPTIISVLPEIRPQQINVELCSLLEKVFSCQMSFIEGDEQFRIVPPTTTRISYADCECDCVFFTLYDLVARGFVRSFVLILFGTERDGLRKQISDTFHTMVSTALQRVSYANLNAFRRDLRMHLSDLRYTLEVCKALQVNGSAKSGDSRVSLAKRENGSSNRAPSAHDDKVTNFLANQKPQEVEKCLRDVEKIVLYVEACLNAYASRAVLADRERRRVDFDSDSERHSETETETETESKNGAVLKGSESDQTQSANVTIKSGSASVRAPRLVLAGGKPWLSGLVDDTYQPQSNELSRKRSGSDCQLNNGNGSENEAPLSATNASTARCAEDIGAYDNSNDMNKRRGGPRAYTELFCDADGVSLDTEFERIYRALQKERAQECNRESAYELMTVGSNKSKASCDAVDFSFDSTKRVNESQQPKSGLRVSLGRIALFDVLLNFDTDSSFRVVPLFDCEVEGDYSRAKQADYAAKFEWLVTGYSNKTVCALLQCVLQGDSVLVCSKSSEFLDHAEAALRAILPHIDDLAKQPIHQHQSGASADGSFSESSFSDSATVVRPTYATQLSSGSKSQVLRSGSSSSSPLSSVSSLAAASDRDEHERDREGRLFTTRIVRERSELTLGELRASVILINKTARKLRCVLHQNSSKLPSGSSLAPNESLMAACLPICDLDEDEFLPSRGMPNSVGIANASNTDRQSAQRTASVQKQKAAFNVSTWLAHTITGLRHVAKPLAAPIDKNNHQNEHLGLTVFADAVRPHILVALQRRIAQLRLDAAHLDAAARGAGTATGNGTDNNVSNACSCQSKRVADRIDASPISADQIGALLTSSVSANTLRARDEREAFAKTFRLDAADSAIIEHFVDRVVDCARRTAEVQPSVTARSWTH